MLGFLGEANKLGGFSSITHFTFHLLLDLLGGILGELADVLLEHLGRGLALGNLALGRQLELRSGLQRLVGLSLLGAPLDLGLLFQQVQHAALAP